MERPRASRLGQVRLGAGPAASGYERCVELALGRPGAFRGLMMASLVRRGKPDEFAGRPCSVT